MSWWGFFRASVYTTQMKWEIWMYAKVSRRLMPLQSKCNLVLTDCRLPACLMKNHQRGDQKWVCCRSHRTARLSISIILLDQVISLVATWPKSLPVSWNGFCKHAANTEGDIYVPEATTWEVDSNVTRQEKRVSPQRKSKPHVQRKRTGQGRAAQKKTWLPSKRVCFFISSHNNRRGASKEFSPFPLSWISMQEPTSSLKWHFMGVIIVYYNVAQE